MRPSVSPAPSCFRGEQVISGIDICFTDVVRACTKVRVSKPGFNNAVSHVDKERFFDEIQFSSLSESNRYRSAVTDQRGS